MEVLLEELFGIKRVFGEESSMEEKSNRVKGNRRTYQKIESDNLELLEFIQFIRIIWNFSNQNATEGVRSPSLANLTKPFKLYLPDFSAFSSSADELSTKFASYVRCIRLPDNFGASISRHSIFTFNGHIQSSHSIFGCNIHIQSYPIFIFNVHILSSFSERIPNRI